MSVSNIALDEPYRLDVIDKLCTTECLRRQAKLIANLLFDLVTYTYINNLKKLNDDILAACYTLYSIYTVNMLRDLLYVIVALRDMVYVWRDMFLIVSGALSLHLMAASDEVKFEARPTSKTARISLRELNEVTELYEKTLAGICERELIPYSRLTLRVTAQVFALSTVVFVFYICSLEGEDSDQMSEHIRRVIEYTINEDSRRALSEYYEMYAATTR